MLVSCVGILVCDIIAADLPKVSAPGEVTFAPNGIKLCVGGHAANVSIDLVKLGQPGADISAAGAVGKDMFGDVIEAELKKHGITTHLERVGVPTSTDLILVVKGEDRRFHIDVGANYHLTPEYVKNIIKVEKPSIFYIGATGMLGKVDLRLAEILEEAKNSGATTFVDPIMPYKHGWDPLLSALKWTDILHCNKEEAMRMTRGKNVDEALDMLLELGVKVVVLTLGESGLIARTRQVKIRLPAFTVKAVDPTGAGDAFCAGLINSLLKTSKSIKEISTQEFIRALVEGEAAGAACVTAVGTTTAVDKETVDKLVREQGERVIKGAFITKMEEK